MAFLVPILFHGFDAIRNVSETVFGFVGYNAYCAFANESDREWCVAVTGLGTDAARVLTILWAVTLVLALLVDCRSRPAAAEVIVLHQAPPAAAEEHHLLAPEVHQDPPAAVEQQPVHEPEMVAAVHRHRHRLRTELDRLKEDQRTMGFFKWMHN